jgi:periplasmic mercuric ion binding protein
MKIKFIFASIMAIVLTVSAVSAQTKSAPKTETVKIWGNCGMCKTTIEKAAKDAGATAAVWNKTTKMLKITYLESATSNAKIQEKIASVGYDTKDLIAPDAVYNELPECCQYERKAAKKN